LPTICYVYCAFVSILWSDLEHYWEWVLRLIRGRLFIYSQLKKRSLSLSKDSRTLGFSAISLLVSALDGRFILLNDIYRRLRDFVSSLFFRFAAILPLRGRNQLFVTLYILDCLTLW